MSSDELADVTQALFTGCDGVVELRALPSRQRSFVRTVSTETVRRFCSNRRGDNCYWGVSTRRAAGDGSLQNCLHLGALFVDLDDAHDASASSVPSPSLGINSGRGQHQYWLLKEPINMQHPNERDGARTLLRRLAAALGGDLAAAEPARILRIPGSWNHKFDPPRPVTITTCDLERRYTLADFNDMLGSLPAREAPPAPIDLSTPVREGQRNEVMYRLIRTLAARQLPFVVIRATVAEINRSTFEPPLANVELHDLLMHATRQPSRARREIAVTIAR
jgi:hypothetical protein